MQEHKTEELMLTMGQRLRAEGWAEAVLQVLTNRGIRLDEESRQRILKCTNMATLKRWLERALSANSLSEVLEA